MRTVKEIRENINHTKTRGAWSDGVKEYALELLDQIAERSEYEGHEPQTISELEDYALNGARDWKQYSEGGCSLIYDGQIAERLCTPSEYTRTFAKGKTPNSRESWIECQSRALFQAYMMVEKAAEEGTK